MSLEIFYQSLLSTFERFGHRMSDHRDDAVSKHMLISSFIYTMNLAMINNDRIARECITKIYPTIREIALETMMITYSTIRPFNSYIYDFFELDIIIIKYIDKHNIMIPTSLSKPEVEPEVEVDLDSFEIINHEDMYEEFVNL